jgi:hypothetical protein
VIPGFGNCTDAASTTIFPVVAPGLAGSNSSVPLTPVAIATMGSIGESRTSITELRFFGSLKS